MQVFYGKKIGLNGTFNPIGSHYQERR